MVFIKKMCVLRQLKQGFSGDGKPLSGLIKVEQYGKNLSVEVSVIGFAPLSTGEYYCILADESGRAELLPLRGKALFNILTELDFSGGFCGVICYVGKDVVPIACGVNGDRRYDFKKILSAALPLNVKNAQTERRRAAPPVAATQPMAEFDGQAETADYPPKLERQTGSDGDFDGQKGDHFDAGKRQQPRSKYDDESVATENYFDREWDGEREQLQEDDAPTADTGADGGESENARQGGGEDEDDQGVRDGFNAETDGYYLSVKGEIDALFAKYPEDERLKEMFPHSEWVRVDESGKEYLVGVIYEHLKAKYICYALPAESPTPPAELDGICAFVPLSLFDDVKGFFILFQSTATGECIRPESV